MSATDHLQGEGIGRFAIVHEAAVGLLPEKGRANALAVYALIAMRAYGDEGFCIARSELADQLKVSVDTVDRAVKALVEARLLDRTHVVDDVGRQGWNRWVLPMISGRRSAAGGPLGSGITPAGGPHTRGATGRAGAAHRRGSIREEKQPISSSPSSKNRAATDPLEGFDEFWALYPRKEAKENARKAWRKMKPEERTLAIFAAPLYATRMRGKDRQYLAHPASWLNGKRWEDHAEPAGSGKAYVKTAPKAKRTVDEIAREILDAAWDDFERNGSVGDWAGPGGLREQAVAEVERICDVEHPGWRKVAVEQPAVRLGGRR